jgi:WD40 repeat protein
LAWDPKTKTLAVCGYSGLITTWALDNPKPTFTKAIKSPGYCIAFTTDGKGVLTGHDNGTVVLTRLGEK